MQWHIILFIFNYDFPPDMEEYVHRFGRTGGRPGKIGKSIRLLAEEDWRYVGELVVVGIMDGLSRKCLTGLGGV